MTKPVPFDATFIIQVQVAIIGIILVCGLFYIWRTVCRIEEKIDTLRAHSAQPQSASAPVCSMQYGSGEDRGEHDDRECEMYEQAMHNIDDGDALMKSVFGDVFVLSSVMPNAPMNNVQVTEITQADEADQADQAADAEGDEIVATYGDDASESPSTSSSNRLSKTKLKAMSLNVLKELCVQRGLSQDGAKAALIDRLLA
jgi:hypothetical protein